ncbi:hypothetical protein GTP55_13440 [Duganella sp. FT109W]|uniref:Uncharacterized protein n=1 Tax=Duganella margarita TaxID=2692170 RepID=A0ABW9WGW3_9BURK|nr:hypothetical protein [Duganella margarita]MYN40379.1 hypothetical protein [Duganella margarita]
MKWRGNHHPYGHLERGMQVLSKPLAAEALAVLRVKELAGAERRAG